MGKSIFGKFILVIILAGINSTLSSLDSNLASKVKVATHNLATTGKRMLFLPTTFKHDLATERLLNWGRNWNKRSSALGSRLDQFVFKLRGKPAHIPTKRFCNFVPWGCAKNGLLRMRKRISSSSQQQDSAPRYGTSKTFWGTQMAGFGFDPMFHPIPKKQGTMKRMVFDPPSGDNIGTSLAKGFGKIFTPRVTETYQGKRADEEMQLIHAAYHHGSKMRYFPESKRMVFWSNGVPNLWPQG